MGLVPPGTGLTCASPNNLMKIRDGLRARGLAKKRVPHLLEGDQPRSFTLVTVLLHDMLVLLVLPGVELHLLDAPKWVLVHFHRLRLG